MKKISFKIVFLVLVTRLLVISIEAMIPCASITTPMAGTRRERDEHLSKPKARRVVAVFVDFELFLNSFQQYRLEVRENFDEIIKNFFSSIQNAISPDHSSECIFPIEARKLLVRPGFLRFSDNEQKLFKYRFIDEFVFGKFFSRHNFNNLVDVTNICKELIGTFISLGAERCKVTDIVIFSDREKFHHATSALSGWLGDSNKVWLASLAGARLPGFTVTPVDNDHLLAGIRESQMGVGTVVDSSSAHPEPVRRVALVIDGPAFVHGSNFDPAVVDRVIKEAQQAIARKAHCREDQVVFPEKIGRHIIYPSPVQACEHELINKKKALESYNFLEWLDDAPHSFTVHYSSYKHSSTLRKWRSDDDLRLMKLCYELDSQGLGFTDMVIFTCNSGHIITLSEDGGPLRWCMKLVSRNQSTATLAAWAKVSKRLISFNDLAPGAAVRPEAMPEA